jgi:hypothetical protein
MKSMSRKITVIFFKIIAIVASIMIFLGSIQSLREGNTPKCSDKQTVDLVLKTSYDTLYNGLEEYFVPKFVRGKLS